MKTMKKFVAFLLVACMVFAFAACGGSKNDAAGKYNMTAMEMGGEDYIAMINEYAPMLGIDTSDPVMILELTSDGKFTMSVGEAYASLMGDEVDASGTYKVDGTKISMTADGDTIEGTIENKVISLSADGMTMKFEKQ